MRSFDGGYSLYELLVALLIFGVISAGVFASVRSSTQLLHRMRIATDLSTSRTILRASFEDALLGACRYSPVPLLKVSNRRDWLSRSIAEGETGTTLTVASLSADRIFQRNRSAVRTNEFCRFQTGLATPEKPPPAALVLSLSSISLRKLGTAPSRTSACPSPAVLTLSSLPDVFDLGSGDGTVEAALPITDIFSLGVEDGILRRRSLLNGENQPILSNLSELTIQRTEAGLTIRFSLRDSAARASPIVLPIPFRNSYDRLDLIW